MVVVASARKSAVLADRQAAQAAKLPRLRLPRQLRARCEQRKVVSLKKWILRDPFFLPDSAAVTRERKRNRNLNDGQLRRSRVPTYLAFSQCGHRPRPRSATFDGRGMRLILDF